MKDGTALRVATAKHFARRVVWGFPPTRSLARARARRITRREGHDIMDRTDLLRFWQQPEPHGNHPKDYIGPVDRSRILALLIESKGIAKDARILEVGCNVGRNLAYLADAGYSALEGIEINPWAVKLLRKTYPQLAGTPIHLGAAEDVLPTLSGPYDLIFTMAVIMHIHPQSGIVFDEISRLSDSVLAVEPAPGEEWASSRIYPHDLRKVFEQRGMRLVSSDLLSEPRWQPNDLHGCAAWQFERRSDRVLG